MTPKEKAIELFNKMSHVCDDIDCHHSLDEYMKDCAMIAVDEIIYDWGYFNGMYEQEVFDSQLKYWQEVKAEIEKI